MLTDGINLIKPPFRGTAQARGEGPWTTPPFPVRHFRALPDEFADT
jgi:hypothetical protein